MRNRRLGLVLILLAITARIAVVLLLRSHEVPRSTFEHGEIAANLLAGRGFAVRFLGADGPTSQQAPLYPILVTGAYALGGVGTPRALLILELGQAVLGGLLVWGILRLAAVIMPGRDRAILFTGAIAAFHPTLVYATTHVQIALLAATLLVWTLDLAYRTRRAWDAVGTGLVLALLILTDPILGLVAPGALWAVRLSRSDRRAWKLGGLTLLVAALAVLPWIARNYRVHGEFVFIKSTFGYAFWQGNCALSEGTDKVVRASVEEILNRSGAGLAAWNRALWEARHEAGYIDDIALTQNDYHELSSVSEPERSRMLFRRVLIDLKSDPARYPKLCLQRLRYFLLLDDTNPKTRSLVYRIGHLGLTGLAVLGLIVMPGNVRGRLGPTLLTVGLVTLFHTLTIASARFHIPIEPLLCLWAGCAPARWTSMSHHGPGGAWTRLISTVPASRATSASRAQAGIGR